MTLRAFLRGFEKDVQADIAEGELDNADIQHIRDIFDQWVEESRRELKKDLDRRRGERP